MIEKRITMGWEPKHLILIGYQVGAAEFPPVAACGKEPPGELVDHAMGIIIIQGLEPITGESEVL